MKGNGELVWNITGLVVKRTMKEKKGRERFLGIEAEGAFEKNKRRGKFEE